MNTQPRRTITWCAFSIMILAACVAASVVVAQQPETQRQQVADALRNTPAGMDAERAKIWNSPNMLRARAWLYDHISKSAKITPEEGQKYIKELENLTAPQMKLWLLRFDHEEDQRQQRYAQWQQSQQFVAQQAATANRDAQKSLQEFDTEQEKAASNEQSELNTEAAERTQRSELNSPVGPYGPNNLGFEPGYGGFHVHYHVYPY
jgi:hypothetical protein